MKSFSVKYLLFLVIFFIGCSIDSDNNHVQKLMVSVGKGSEPFPDELLQFLPEGYAPLMLEKRDFNKDGLSDYFLVLRTLLPTDLGEEKTRELNRRLRSPSLIIVRQKDNKFKLHTKNERAILQGYALGLNGEELKISADSLGGGFTITHITRDIDNQGIYGIDAYHFVYDQARDAFYLNHIKEETGILKPELHPELLKTSVEEYKPKVGEFDIKVGAIPFISFDFVKYIEAGGPDKKNDPN